MKKLTSVLLAVALLLTLAACGGNETPEATNTPETTNNTEESTAPSESTGKLEEIYGITYEGVKLVPGAAFDAAALPEASSVMEVPSCAFEGTDKAYNYGTFELTAYNEGNGEIIYSIYLLDPNVATDEGLYLGDTLSRAQELYGEDYERKDTQITYTAGNTMLILILQGDSIASIEYRVNL